MKLSEKMKWILFHMRRGWKLYELDGPGVRDRAVGFYIRDPKDESTERRIRKPQVEGLLTRRLIRGVGRTGRIRGRDFELTKKGREVDLV